MRKTILGMVAAAAVMMTAGASPAMACGGGLFQSSCSPCGYNVGCAAPVYAAPVVAAVVAAPVYGAGCNTGCGGGWGGGCGGWLWRCGARRSDAAVLLRQPGPDLYRPGRLAPEPVYAGILAITAAMVTAPAMATALATATAPATVTATAAVIAAFVPASGVTVTAAGATATAAGATATPGPAAASAPAWATVRGPVAACARSDPALI